MTDTERMQDLMAENMELRKKLETVLAVYALIHATVVEHEDVFSL